MIKFSTFRTTSVYSIPLILSVVELIDVSNLDILNTWYINYTFPNLNFIFLEKTKLNHADKMLAKLYFFHISA